jgi:Sigma-70, region 4
MATIDSLPPDQRAVLQLVLQRGRSYDEIANLLSIDRAAVRQRALDALEALTPAGADSAAAERSLITDYLLGQLPAGVADQVHALLATSAADNQWARALSRELADFGGRAAEIPELRTLEADAAVGRQTAASRAEAAPAAPVEPELDAPMQTPVEPPSAHRQADVAAAPAQSADREPPAEQRTDPQDDLWFDDEQEPPADLAQSYLRSDRERPAGSRKGGLILLGGVAAVAIVVIVLAVAGVFSGGSGNNSADPGHGGSAKTDLRTGSSNTAKYLAQINLTAPDGAKSPAGIVQVVQETITPKPVKGKKQKPKVVKGIVVYAVGVTPNTSHDAYAVWLSNPGGGSKFIGFVPKLVGKNGKLQTDGALPSDAADYKQILVTLETANQLGSNDKPTRPGTVVLSGAFTETAKAK